MKGIRQSKSVQCEIIADVDLYLSFQPTNTMAYIKTLYAGIFCQLDSLLFCARGLCLALSR